MGIIGMRRVATPEILESPFIPTNTVSSTVATRRTAVMGTHVAGLERPAYHRKAAMRPFRARAPQLTFGRKWDEK